MPAGRPLRLEPAVPVAPAADLRAQRGRHLAAACHAGGDRDAARGGNAVDAALATAIALTVVEPCSNGLGSDLFAIVWDGSELVGFNASGRAPAAWTPARFAGLAAMPRTGWDTITIPGAVSGWVALSRRFGKLPFADLFAPAIRYARERLCRFAGRCRKVGQGRADTRPRSRFRRALSAARPRRRSANVFAVRAMAASLRKSPPPRRKRSIAASWRKRWSRTPARTEAPTRLPISMRIGATG